MNLSLEEYDAHRCIHIGKIGLQTTCLVSELLVMISQYATGSCVADYDTWLETMINKRTYHAVWNVSAQGKFIKTDNGFIFDMWVDDKSDNKSDKTEHKVYCFQNLHVWNGQKTYVIKQCTNPGFNLAFVVFIQKPSEVCVQSHTIPSNVNINHWLNYSSCPQSRLPSVFYCPTRL